MHAQKKAAAMKTIEKLGTTWTVRDDCVQVFLYVECRDVVSVQRGLKRRLGLDSSEITPDDFPPEVAPDTLLVSVPVEKLDRFIPHVVKMLADDDVQVYTSAEQALDVSTGELDYGSLPQAQALEALLGATPDV
jgi:hypothetical protein